MTGLKRDLHYALRMFRRTPFFSSMATLVLAVAIGVATAVFSLYNHLEVQPVPGVQGSNRLVSIGLVREGQWLPLNLTQYEQLAESLTGVDALFAVGFPFRAEAHVNGADIDARVRGLGPDSFAALGVPLLLGVDLDAASSDPEANNIVIGERMWRLHFDADPAAIGATVTLAGTDYQVVGVAGGGFQGVQRNAGDDAWVPLYAQIAARRGPPGPPGISEADREAMARAMSRVAPALYLYGRLASGVAADALARELDTVLARMREQWTSFFPVDLIESAVFPGTPVSPRAHTNLVRQTELLIGGAVLVVLVASLNLASFVLARGSGRLQELRTRLAIGASRGAIVRQLFVEAAALVAIASALGLLMHFWLKSLLLRLPPFVEGWSRMTAVDSDWRVFVFALAAAIFVACITGLVPALRIAQQPSLAAASPTAVGRHAGRLQPLLALQVFAATLIVLAGALFVAELWRLERADVGLDPVGVHVVTAGWDRRAGGSFRFDEEQGRAMKADFDARLGTLPGVDEFAFAGHIPVVSGNLMLNVVDLAAVEQPPEQRRRAYSNSVSPGLFRLLRIPMLHGRPFADLERTEVVVSKMLAEQLWGRADVIGEQFHPPTGVSFSGGTMVMARNAAGESPPRETFTVVGVAGDVGVDPQPIYYRSLGSAFVGATVIVRGSVAPEVLQPLVEELTSKHMPARTVESVRPMDEMIHDLFRGERARSRLAVGAGMLALVLTMIGLYASMQHTVETRRGELAVRKAIGASDDTIVAMILRRALSIVALGAVGALLSAIVFSERLSGLLFGLDATDPRAWGATIAVICATGALAAWLPARRAGKVDPAVALRYE
ncbi:MAG: FtsX-like permease family protein [Gammaproteobacteria bacterium]